MISLNLFHNFKLIIIWSYFIIIHFIASQEAAKRRQQTTKTNSDSKGDLKLGISLEESIQILNVKKELNKEEVEKNFNHLFKVNQKEKGGSFYIQSKVRF